MEKKLNLEGRLPCEFFDEGIRDAVESLIAKKVDVIYLKRRGEKTVEDSKEFLYEIYFGKSNGTKLKDILEQEKMEMVGIYPFYGVTSVVHAITRPGILQPKEILCLKDDVLKGEYEVFFKREV